MEELYRENSRIIYFFLFSRCQDEALAEDLMQETFVRAIECIENYDGSCKVSTWLCQIAKHLLYQHWARSRHEELAEPDEAIPAGDNTESQALQCIELADVWEKLNLLPDTVRRVMTLRVLSDLSYREIGALMGKSENWARVTFFRGKKQLLKEVQGDEG